MRRDAQLYGITTPTLCADPVRLLHGVREALRGGLRWVQYRHKHASTDTARRQARRLQSLCAAFDATLIINDRVWLAEELGLGVHLGQTDPPVGLVRRRLGADAPIGISCHADTALAQATLEAGASYVSIGRLFASTTKPEAPPAELQCLRTLRSRTDGMLCAIGGIGAAQLPAVRDAGADLIAVGAALFDAPDPGAACAAMISSLQSTGQEPPA